jgi:hypothetical protein
MRNNSIAFLVSALPALILKSKEISLSVMDSFLKLKQAKLIPEMRLNYYA